MISIVFKSIRDLFWIIVPVLISVFFLFIFGALQKLTDSPDIVIMSFILFGESLWLLRENNTVKNDKKESMEQFGLIGFIISIILSTILLIMSYVPCANLQFCIKPVFWYSCAAMLLVSFIYAVYIRTIINKAKTT